jgi:hypothetical protein
MSNEVEIRVSSKNDASKGFKDAERDADKLGDKLKGIAGKAGDGLGKIGGKLTEGLGKAAKAGPLMVAGAGLAIGGVVMGGISKALEQGNIKATLAAQLGLAGADADKYGAAAAELYKTGYGASIQETADITKAAFENGLVSVKSTKQAIMEVGQQVAVYAKLTGEDAVKSTAAVSQMLKTGLAKNATEAFDILVKGQQLGINKSEDLLDTFNEYGTQFRKLGLDGKDALGLINQMLQGGARDSDTAADAVKEFSIRAVDGSKTTVDAYKSLHLNVEKTTAAFGKGGPAAKKAFGDILDQLNTIKDPVERNRIGVELFGTKWEDLGAAIGKADLDTAAASLGKVAGASQDVNDALSATPAAKLDTLKRKLEQTFVETFTKYALPTVTKFVDWLAGPGVFTIAGAFVDIGLALGVMVKAFGPGIKLMSDIFLGFVGQMLDGAARAFGWVPNIGPKLQSAAANFNTFKDGTGKAFDAVIAKANDWDGTLRKTKTELKLKADKADLDSKLAKAKQQLKDPALTATKRAQLTATIKSLQQAVNNAQTKIDTLHGKTVTVTLDAIVTKQYAGLLSGKYDYYGNPTGKASGGTVGGYAAGGNPSPGLFLVGETGPELLKMSGGAVGRVTPAANTRQEMHQRGVGGGQVQLVIRAGDGSRYTQFLMEELRRVIANQGGNVQAVLGR